MRKRGWLFCLVLLAGCSSEAPRGAIEGEVFLAGKKPLPSGKIRFLPLGETKGSVVFADITQGKYQLETAKGPVVGKNRVEITAFRKSSEKVPIPDGPPGRFQEVDEQYLPAQFNVESKMDVDIVPGQNKKDFTLDGVR